MNTTTLTSTTTLSRELQIWTLICYTFLFLVFFPFAMQLSPTLICARLQAIDRLLVCKRKLGYLQDLVVLANIELNQRFGHGAARSL